VHEHIFTAAFLLDEAEALLSVEELHRALAGADDLGGHAVEAAAAATATRSTTVAAEPATAATAAEAIVATATEAVSATTVVALPEITGRPAKGIEPVLSETIALVATATSPAPII